MTQEQQQELFNYLHDELGIIALESNLNEIEDIINPCVYSYNLISTNAARTHSKQPEKIIGTQH